MTRSKRTRAAAAVIVAAVGIGTAGCDNQTGIPGEAPAASVAPLPGVAPATTSTTTTTTKAPKPVDYARLLIQGPDVSIPTDAYTAQAPIVDPDGRPGAEVLLVNQDQTRAISVLVVGLPDAASAPAAQAEATANLTKSVTVANSQPSPVGTGGTVVTGTSPDGSKSVTVLLFTQGAALARLEFDGVPGQPAPAAFVTNTGQKQNIALRVGLPA